MCGRYAISAPPQKLKDLFGTENILTLPPRYNAAPGQDLPVIVHNRMGLARWGFGEMINARGETLDEVRYGWTAPNLSYSRPALIWTNAESTLGGGLNAPGGSRRAILGLV